MRLCVPIPCFFKKISVPDAIRRASALGFDAVETYNWRGLDPIEVRETCAEYGVEFLSMCTTEFRMTDPAFRSDWVAGVRESVEAAKRMGVGRLITQVGPDTGAPRTEQRQSIVDALKEAKPILEDAGVILMLEPLNTYVNHPGYYLTSSQEAFGIVREIGSPSVKVVFDIYHQQVMEGNIIPNVTNNLDCIAHLHAAGHPGRHELQLGETDYKNVFAAIDAAGYTGACGLEYSPTTDPEESLSTANRIYG